MKKVLMILFCLLVVCNCVSGHDFIPADFPTDSGSWEFTPAVGGPTQTEAIEGVVFDESTSKWHAMGADWADEAELLLYTSNDGLSNWVAAPGNPVIEYDDSIPKRDDDWYVQMPNYGRYPDGAMKKLDGKWVVVVVNFDGRDSDLHWLTSNNGFDWTERGDTGVDIGPEGSGDRGEQWPTNLIYNPDNQKWYLFYHGGGNYDTGSGRTVGVAYGDTPKSLTEWDGYFEHNNLITQNALVMRDREGWIMLFMHGFDEDDGIWYARSDDLLHWSTEGRIIGGDADVRTWNIIQDDDTVTWRLYGVNGDSPGVFEATVPKTVVDACESQGYSCCDSCQSDPHPEYNSDCGTQVCCGECVPKPLDCTGLVMLMNFDEDSLIVEDFSGNDNNGNTHGNPLFNPLGGRFSGAFQFDGVDDYISVPHDSSIDFTDEDLSYSFWIKGAESEVFHNERVLVKGTSSGGCGAGRRYELFITEDSFGFVIDDDSTKSSFDRDYSGYLDNTWHHVAFTRDSSSNEIKIYLDGYQNGITETDVSGDISNSCPLYIARSSDDVGDLFAKISIDDLSIWNRKLSDQEILDMFNSNAPLPCGTSSTAPTANYTILKINSPPIIDGNINEFSNANIITLTNSRGTSGDYKLMWDNNALYIAASVSDTQLAAAYTERDDRVWRDDALELFFDTLNDKGASRQADDYKFFVNVLNVHTDSNGEDRTWNATYISEVTVSGTVNQIGDTDTSYMIEVAIPWSEWIGSPPVHGKVWGFDLALRERNDTGESFYTIWANTDGDSNNNPDGWGEMLFTVRADSSRDGCVEEHELIPFIDSWKYDSTAYPMREVMEAVTLWSRGTGCV